MVSFRYRNAENKNIIFALEISKDKKVSDLEIEVKKEVGVNQDLPFSLLHYDLSPSHYLFFSASVMTENFSGSIPCSMAY